MSRKLGVVGARGRLGQSVVDAATALGWQITLTATRDGWEQSATPDVVIDASHRCGVARVAGYCARAGCGLVEAVSGLEASARSALADAGAIVPVVVASNLAYGHHLHARAVAAAVGMLSADEQWSVCVSDRHPASKRDRPSATARELVRICESMGVGGVDIVSHRKGPPVSDHWVTLARGDETLTLAHSTRDLGAAAHGALRAADWLEHAGPGLWSMTDVWEAGEEIDHDNAQPASGSSPIAGGGSRS